MEGSPAHMTVESKMHESDIAVPEEYLVTISQSLEWQPREESTTAVSSANADDRGNRRVLYRMDEVICSIGFRSCKISMPLEDVLSISDFESSVLEKQRCSSELFRFKRAGRSQQSNSVSASKRAQ